MKKRATYLVSSAVILIASLTVMAVQQSPKTAEDYNNRGLVRQSKNDLDGAIADYTKALSFKSMPLIQAIIYNNRANAFMAKNDFTAAAADYGSAIQLQPTNFENYYNRGIALYNKRELDAARTGDISGRGRGARDDGGHEADHEERECGRPTSHGGTEWYVRQREKERTTCTEAPFSGPGPSRPASPRSGF